MSAGFAALFGTPLAAAVFTMEVISIGVMYYALVPLCIFPLSRAALSSRFGLKAEAFLWDRFRNSGFVRAALSILSVFSVPA